MSSGAKQLLQYAEETVNGVTPTPFARKVLPFTTVSLDQTASKETSNTITDTRLAAPSTITGLEVAGDIEAEFRYGTYDDLIAGSAFNEWQNNVLTFGGDVKKSFSILRGYSDVEVYQLFSGVHVNTWNISVPEQGLITTSFGLMGKSRRASTTLPIGVVTPDVLNPAYSSVSVGNILIDGASQAGIACVTAFDFTWDNTMQVQRCLGDGLDIGALIATSAVGTGSVTIAWSSVAGQDYYERQFKNQTISFELFIRESSEEVGNSYTLTIPTAEITASLPSGGKDEILQATLEFTVVKDAPTLTRVPKTVEPPEDE